MEVILLESLHKLGSLGDTVVVKPGFARNFLIPTGKATRANKANLAKFEGMRAELEKKENETLAKADTRAASLKDLVITLTVNASAEGKLYGSVGAAEIEEAVLAAGVEVSKKELILVDGPIRHIGEHTVSVHLHAKIDASFLVKVLSSTAGEESEKQDEDLDEDFDDIEE